METGESSNQPHAMIEIRQDALRFSFPAITAEIERLLEPHIERLVRAFIAEDREKVIEQVLESTYDKYRSPSFKEDVRSTVLGYSNEDIARLVREHCQHEPESDDYDTPGQVEIEFQRTLRIPDNGMTHYLPPGLGKFPLRHVDDYAERVSKEWLERGGVLMPMYQAEALWLNFDGEYPFAIKIAAGKINAVSGEPWLAGLNRVPQDYIVTPEQPWLDGFAVEKGVIRQFVAMPLGAGYSVEEQMSGKAEFGGLQIQVIPIKASKYFESDVKPRLPKSMADVVIPIVLERDASHRLGALVAYSLASPAADMGLGAGGRMMQEIYEDPYASDDWDLEQSCRCFVHLCDALMWREVTGENPPHEPVTARDYERAGLPWFDYYRDDLAALEGSKQLAGIKSVNALFEAKSGKALEGNESVEVPFVIPCSPKKKAAKEWNGE